MQLSQYLTGAHIVAEGQLEADVRWEPVAPQWLAGIVGWKALMGHGPETQPQRRAFADGPGHGHYSTALTRFWTDIGKAGQGTPACLIYLHCGLHPDPRTPLLPHLLADLDHRGAVHALRVDTDAALGDALAFAQAMVRRAGRVIVLWDRTERLLAAPQTDLPATGVMHYAILSGEGVSAPRPAPTPNFPTHQSVTGVADAVL